MSIYIFFYIICGNLVLTFNNKKSKFISLLTIFLMILFAAGAGPLYDLLSEYSLDYVNYEFRYNNLETYHNNEQGYALLMYIGNLLKLDFFTFRLLIISLCYLIIYKYLILEYALNPHLVLVLYMMYPMIVDSWQLRNFIGMTIMLISAIFLIEGKKKNKLKFLTGILIASTMHIVFLFYLPLILVQSRNERRIIKITVFLSIILVAIMVLNDNQFPFANEISALIEDERVSDYLKTKTQFGYLIPLFLNFMTIFLVSWCKKKYVLQADKNILANNKIILFHELIYWINIFAIIFSPFFLISIHLYRLVRNLSILNYILYANTFSILKNRFVLKTLLIFLILFNVGIWFYLDLFILTDPNHVIVPFFEANLFFDAFKY